MIVRALAALAFGCLGTGACAQGAGPSGSAALAPNGAHGLAAFLGACIAGGLASLLTPCVFPMIPVTISYFSKRGGSGALAAAIAYGGGIVSTFAVIGVLAAAVFGATGISNFAANPWVNVAMGALFVVLALGLFGLFEVQVPGVVTTHLARGQRRAGLAGPAFMGATFALTSFTCTMPIAAALLAAASRGNLLFPTLGMCAYGLAFATPFVALALFPSAIAQLPRSGEWLASVKPVLAYVELAAAVKFFSNADLAWCAGWITKPVFLALWVAILGMLATYLLGLPDALRTVSWTRRVVGLGALASCAYLLAAMNGVRLGYVDSFLPPEPYPSSKGASPTSAHARRTEAATFADAMRLARAEQRRVFVDFTGVTCTNCRWMEKNVFPAPAVAHALDGYINVRLYTDRPTAADRANQALQAKMAGNQALPTYVVVRPNGTVEGKFEGAARDPGEFAAFLRKPARK